MPSRRDVHVVVFSIAAIALAFALWALVDVLLLVFAAVLIAIGLTSLAEQLSSRARLGYRAALALIVAALVATIGGVLYFFGASIAADIGQIGEAIPRSLARLREAASGMPWAQTLLDEIRNLDVVALGRGLAPQAFGFLSSMAGAVLSVGVVLVGAVYFAFGAKTYRDGVLELTPRDLRADVDRFMAAAKDRLQRWFLGQLVLMLVIGVSVGVTLAVIGVPSALALGLFAGLVEFVPFLGPFIAATAAVLVAATVAPELALWTIVAFVVIQQVENQVLEPLVLKRAASLPAALTIFAIIAFGVLFGAVGAVLAAPLAVLFAVAVQTFYLREQDEEEHLGSSPSEETRPTLLH